MKSSWILALTVVCHCCHAHLITQSLFPGEPSQFYKLWNHYVDASHLHALTQVTTWKHTSCSAVLHSYWKTYSTYHFIIFKTVQECYSEASTNITHLIGNFCDHTKWTHKFPLNTETTQQLSPLNDSFCVLPKELNCSKYISHRIFRLIVLRFDLYEQLKLNITLVKLKLELTYKCVNEFVGMGQNLSLPKQNRICGIMPVMTYFMGPECFILLQIGMAMKAERIKIQLQVVDPSHINTAPCEDKKFIKCYNTGSLSNQIAEHHFWAHHAAAWPYRGPVYENLHNKHFVLIFHILCVKYLTIGAKVKQHGDMTQVFDGPYIDYNLLLKGQSVHQAGFNLTKYVSSTFQMTFKTTYLHSKDWASLRITDIIFKYIRAAIPFCSCQAESKPKILDPHLPSSVSQSCARCQYCSKRYCRLAFYTRDRSNVNVTFNYIQFYGPNIDSCRQV